MSVQTNSPHEGHVPTPPEGAKLYDPKFYDAGYYGGAARGGFKEYQYSSDEQKLQLAIKYDSCSLVNHQSVLFIGCALGFEVAHWIKRGHFAAGVDVSEYAIANQIPEAHGQCRLYDGSTIPLEDSSIDLVACFDVLPHLPDPMRFELARNMVRVARKGIVWRQIVKSWRNKHRECDGQDGAWIHYWPFERWDQEFSGSSKFHLHHAVTHNQYETTATFLRT